ncbi:cbb3-type cytochrome c oxidase N-terminal domain-containing protein [Chryseolinea sp. T2]|uniref:cbb3-type cytochrome c oxidase N-terminal domain-containing protein n=1 Tax=Chryseolinea sp. T2 TaxID=3129255 RepID=UPI003078778D
MNNKLKRVTVAALLSLSTFAAFAQDKAEAEKTFMSDPINNPLFPVYVIGLLIIIVIALIVVTGISMIRVINVLAEQAERERAAKLGVAYKPRQGWWSRFSRQMNDSIPLEDESTIELDHNFDGIKELDNHLPPWWKWLFYATAVWAVVYMVVYHVSDSYPLMIQEYDTEVADAAEQIQKLKASQPQEAIDESALTFTADAAVIGKGKEVFNTMNCGSCHRPDGGGNAIGPNLTDEFWIHGGDIKQVFSTIKNGAVDKGMPAWGKSLSPADVRNVAFFVMSLQGTNPANPKAPQGEKFVAPALPKAANDTTTVQAAL